jgi:hypothetical protein
VFVVEPGSIQLIVHGANEIESVAHIANAGHAALKQMT